MPRRNHDEEDWDWVTFWVAIGFAILLMVLLFMVGAWFVHLMEQGLETGP